MLLSKDRVAPEFRVEVDVPKALDRALELFDQIPVQEVHPGHPPRKKRHPVDNARRHFAMTDQAPPKTRHPGVWVAAVDEREEVGERAIVPVSTRSDGDFETPQELLAHRRRSGLGHLHVHELRPRSVADQQVVSLSYRSRCSCRYDSATFSSPLSLRPIGLAGAPT